MINLAKYSNSLVFSIVVFLAIIFNAFFFTNNNLLIFFSFLLLMVYTYSYRVNHKQQKINIDVNIDNIIDLLQEKHKDQEYINSDLYIMFKKPKDFKYIKMNKLFNQDLLDLQVLYRMDSFLYYEIFVIIETFLKYYYKGIQENDVESCLQNMRMCFMKLKAYQNEVQITISKSKNIKVLETNVRQTFGSILVKMKNKISILNEFLKT